MNKIIKTMVESAKRDIRVMSTCPIHEKTTQVGTRLAMYDGKVVDIIDRNGKLKAQGAPSDEQRAQNKKHSVENPCATVDEAIATEKGWGVIHRAPSQEQKAKSGCNCARPSTEEIAKGFDESDKDPGPEVSTTDSTRDMFQGAEPEEDYAKGGLVKDMFDKWGTKPADTKFEELGIKIGQLVDEKQRAYGNSFGNSGKVLRALYPDGISPEQYDDALCVVRIIDKLFRIATKKDALGESPYRDIAGYGLLGAHFLGAKGGGPKTSKNPEDIDPILRRKAA